MNQIRNHRGAPTWWQSAALGAVVTVALGAVRFVEFGTGPPGNDSWYTTAGGRTYTGLVLDNVQFLQMADSASPAQHLAGVAPFSSRWLAPWLAAHTGLGPLTGLWAINMLLLVAGGVCLARLAHHLTRGDDRWTLVAVLVWSCAWPVLWYGGKPLVDAAAVALMTMAMLALYRRRLLVGLLLLVAAVWAKEVALVLVPVAMTRELLAHDGPSQRWHRWGRAAAWPVAGAVGYLSAGWLGPAHDLTFATWIPASFSNASRFIAMNLGPKGLLQFGLAAVPGLLGVLLWWSARRRGTPSLPRADALPLVAGVVAATLLSCWSIVSALWDGRTAWTSVPMGALLIGIWGSRLEAPLRWRGVVRAVILAGVASFVLLVASAVVGTALDNAVNGSAAPAALVVPRFSTPAADGGAAPLEASGSGDDVIEVQGGVPTILEFDSTEPVQIAVDGNPLLAAPVPRGQVLVDVEDATDVQLVTNGRWTASSFPATRATPWEGLSPLAGDGPRVLLFPGGLTRSIVVERSGDPVPRLSAAGRCRLGTCGELTPTDGGVVVPAGTEALVVDAAGPWELVPVRLAGSATAEVLDGSQLRDPD